MDNDNQNLFMVVEIDKSKRHPEFAWVAFAGLDSETTRYRKHWINLSENSQIDYGAIGTLGENNVFNRTQDDSYYDEYRVAKVLDVRQIYDKRIDNSFYKYKVGLPNGDFDMIPSGVYQTAIPGNYLLVHFDECIMNLTTQKNCYDLWQHYDIRKYCLHPSYRGFMANKYFKSAALKDEYYTVGEKAMPAVVTSRGRNNNFNVFMPNEKNKFPNIIIKNAHPRPSDVVALNPTEQEGVFALMANLSQLLEIRDMQCKFGPAMFQASMDRYLGERG